jgi:hypothetical protein
VRLAVLTVERLEGRRQVLEQLRQLASATTDDSGAARELVDDRQLAANRRFAPFELGSCSEQAGRVGVAASGAQASPSASYSRRNPSNKRRCACSSWRMSMTMSWVTQSTWSVASIRRV